MRVRVVERPADFAPAREQNHANELPEGWAVAELQELCEPGRPITYGILKLTELVFAAGRAALENPVGKAVYGCFRTVIFSRGPFLEQLHRAPRLPSGDG